MPAQAESAGKSPDRRQSGDIPVLILNWNGVGDTIECIDALLQTAGVGFRVILVDNGSEGDDFERLSRRYASDRRVEGRRNEQNLGFARGVNAVLRALLAESDSRPEFVALLNNDAIPEPGWLAALVSVAGSTGAGAVASKMIRHDDSGQTRQCRSCISQHRRNLAARGRATSRDYSEPASSRGRKRRRMSAALRHAARYRDIRRVLQHRV